MIYDCCTFYNELELLELRLNELMDVVEVFVVVESNQTFSGHKKPFIFEKNKKRFSKFIDKIRYIQVRDLDDAPDAWTLPYFTGHTFQINNIRPWSREIYQRNAIVRGLAGASTNDIILISDVDEIPRAESVRKLGDVKGISAFEQNNYNYFYNCQVENKWIGTRATQYSEELIPEAVRTSQTFTTIKNSGWHFSYIGGLKMIQEKIQAYSHQEHNRPEYIDDTHIQKNVENGLDLFGRPFAMDYVHVDASFPSYLVKNKRKFAEHLHLVPKRSENEKWLRQELFKAREQVYWKNAEIEKLLAALSEYQRKYRLAVKWGPLSYIMNKIKK